MGFIAEPRRLARFLAFHRAESFLVTHLVKTTGRSEGGTKPQRPLPAWLPLIPLFATFIFLAFRSAGPIDDPDVWWHLRLGEEFRGSWAPGDPGQLSEFATRPWVSTQWLLEVVASHIHDRFQLTGVAWLGGLAVLVLGAIIYVATRDRSGPMVASAATALGLLGASMSLSPRPQVVSFILTTVFVAAWLRTSHDHKARWWLVGVSWLWANIHGMWFVGPMIGGSVVLGMLLDRSVGHRQALRLAAIPALGVVAAAITPVGPQLLLAPLATESMGQFVTEWQAPNITKSPAAIATTGMLLVTVFAEARSSKPTSWTRLLLLAVAALWTIYAYRTVAVGAVIAAPLFADAIQTWASGLERSPLLSRERRLFVAALAASVVTLTVAVPSLSTPEGDEVPRRLSEELGALANGTVILNAYELGGWLEWQHRNVVPVIDPMLDAYPVDYMADYQDASGVRPGWVEFVRRSGAHVALLEMDSPLGLALKQRLDWETTSVDSQAGYALLRAPDSDR